MELGNAYQLLPGKNCGICGYGSCNTFLRHIIFAQEDLLKCEWLTLEEIHSIQLQITDITLLPTKVKHLAVFNPCTTDDALVMAEVYLADKEVDYGYLDPEFCEVLPVYFDNVKCSPLLGIGRIETDTKEILVSQTGKIVVRHAQNESDVLQTCDVISHLVSGYIICPCYATGIECVSHLCTCAECDILTQVETAENTESVQKYEEHARNVLSRLWAGELISHKEIISLHQNAVFLLAETMRGLVLFSLVHHLSLMQEALTDAQNDTEKELAELTELVTDLISRIPHEYQKITSYLKEQDSSLSRELYKIIFHANRLAEIKTRYLENELENER
ncbi:MAG: (Fe-S)-binding protein [Candidatus Methanofastidiosia archaeon]|jgi:hypothetical protein